MSRIPKISDVFTFGPTLRLRHCGSFTVETWQDRWRDGLAQAFWPKPTFTVIAIDTEAGTITVK